MKATVSDDPDLIWAFSSRGRYAHAYQGRTWFERGFSLCGIRGCKPERILATIDRNDETFRRILCPWCLQSLPFADNLRPIDDRSREKIKIDRGHRPT